MIPPSEEGGEGMGVMEGESLPPPLPPFASNLSYESSVTPVVCTFYLALQSSIQLTLILTLSTANGPKEREYVF